MAENSGRTAGPKKPKKTPKGKPFAKGESGNPGGRPPTPPDVKEALRAACPAAVAELARLVTEGLSENIRLQAALAIVERVLGKVATPLDLAVSGKDGAPPV